MLFFGGLVALVVIIGIIKGRAAEDE